MPSRIAPLLLVAMIVVGVAVVVSPGLPGFGSIDVQQVQATAAGAGTTPSGGAEAASTDGFDPDGATQGTGSVSAATLSEQPTAQSSAERSRLQSTASAADPDASGSTGTDASDSTDGTDPPAGPASTSALASSAPGSAALVVGSDRVDLLQVIAADSGESLAYEFTVRGAVQKTRLSERIQAGINDEVIDDGDGTVTVRGTTANQFGDAYLFSGEVLSIQRTGGGSGMQLSLNSMPVTPDDLVDYDVVEVISTDSGERLTYELTVDGTIERTQTHERIAGNPNDEVIDNGDGTTTVRGTTGNQFGDAFRIDGEILRFEKTGGDSDYFTRLDGLEVDLAAPDGVTQIDDCTVISSSGRYELTTDVANASATACIEIDSSDVVFDGGGHVVDGTDANDTAGVLVRLGEDPVRNVTIRNVATRDWSYGISASASADPVSAGGFQDARIERVTSTSNRRGIELEAAENVTVAESTIRGNGGTGVSLYYYRDDNSVVDSTIVDNGGAGVRAFEGGSVTTIQNDTITGNSGDGVRFQNGADRPVVVDNVVTANGGAGVVLSIGYDATIARNRVESNGETGIEVSDAYGDRIVDNAVVDNDEGILLFSSSQLVLRNNTATDNAGHGIALQRASNNSVVQNLVCDNGADPQILVDDASTGNTLADNTVVCS